MMEEFERTVLQKFPEFPGYRTGDVSVETAQAWYTAYQRLVEWLHERSADGALLKKARDMAGSESGAQMVEASLLLGSDKIDNS